MNQAGESAQNLLFDICKGISDTDEVEVVVCPSFTVLSALDIPADCPVAKGAQDIHWEDKGTFTGEVSGPMIAEAGCKYAIVGHSERRWKLNEDNETVNEKFKAVLRNNITPILCVGERLADREDNRTNTFLEQQLTTAFEGVGQEDIESLVVAYEPVWAIGTGQIKSRASAAPAIVAEAFQSIEKFLASQGLADKTRLVYGGSVDADNAEDFVQLDQNQGFLVGGASLDAEQFVAIVKAFSK